MRASLIRIVGHSLSDSVGSMQQPLCPNREEHRVGMWASPQAVSRMFYLPLFAQLSLWDLCTSPGAPPHTPAASHPPDHQGSALLAVSSGSALLTTPWPTSTPCHREVKGPAWTAAKL